MRKRAWQMSGWLVVLVVGSGSGKSGSDQVADEMDEVQRMLGSRCG